MMPSVSIVRSSLLVILLLTLFVLLGGRSALAGVVVGTGTTGSCTETAFDTALNIGGAVTFNCGPSAHTITITGRKEISIDTTIDGGNKITLSASNTYHFQVYADKTLDLRNITLSNANSIIAGAVENFGTTKTNNVTFFKNYANGGEGGAITNRGTLVIKNSTFLKNKANTAGGAIWSDSALGSVKIKGSLFKGNKATDSSAEGGAIMNLRGDVRLIKSTLFKNKADEGGGYYAAGDSTNKIKKSTLESNKGHNGAGLENRGGMEVISSVFLENIGTGMGGGVYQGGSMSINKTRIHGNYGDRGAGIFISAPSTAIFNSTISGNIATHYGGGVFSESDASIENSTLSSNVVTGAAQGGGGWHQDSDEATFQFITVANNSATFGGGINANALQNPAPEITIKNTALSSNPGGNCAGGSTIKSSGFNLSNDTTCSALTKPSDKPNTPSALGGLMGNGGPTETHHPLAGSQLINNGGSLGGITTDQRGLPRPVGPKPDIGAVEVQ